jgi:hypothetical protein
LAAAIKYKTLKTVAHATRAPQFLGSENQENKKQIFNFFDRNLVNLDIVCDRLN